MDKKILLIIILGIVGVVLLVGILAVVRSRGGDLMPSLLSGTGSAVVKTGGSTDDSSRLEETAKPRRAICGDGICTPPETPLGCQYDCRHELFGGFSITGETGEDILVYWVTTQPTTSIVEFSRGPSNQYSRLLEEELVTKHKIIIEDRTSSTLSIKISGADETGTEHLFASMDYER